MELFQGGPPQSVDKVSRLLPRPFLFYKEELESVDSSSFIFRLSKSLESLDFASFLVSFLV